MSKKKQLPLIDIPQNAATNVPLSKTFINPLTGQALVSPEVVFSDAIQDLYVVQGTQVFTLRILLKSNSGATISVDFYPRVPTLTFKSAVPDLTYFSIILSFTDTFEKSVTIPNLSFYPASTQDNGTSTTFTQSTVISQSLYQNALTRLFEQYSFEEFLDSLPDASIPYNSNDLDAKRAHLAERAELTRVYVKLQLSTVLLESGTNSPTYFSPLSWIGLGIVSLDTKVLAVTVNSYEYPKPYFYRNVTSVGIASYTYEFKIYNRTYYINASVDSTGRSVLIVHPLQLARLTDYVEAPYSASFTRAGYKTRLVKIKTTYGVTIDLTAFERTDPEYSNILFRYGNAVWLNENDDWSPDTSLIPRYAGISYIVDNLGAEPVLTLWGHHKVHSGLADRVLPNVPNASYNFVVEVNDNHRSNRLVSQLYTYFNSTPAPYSYANSYYLGTDVNQRNLYGWDTQIPINQTTTLINGFTSIRVYPRRLRDLSFYANSFNFEIFYPNFIGLTVTGGVISGFQLAKAALKVVKGLGSVSPNGNGSVVPMLPSCKVYVRHYVYSKVGKIVTYTPSSFVVEGYLTKNSDGTLSLLDASRNQITFRTTAKKNDQLRLLADFKNLQDFYGIRQLLATCDEPNYIEIARVTV